jgi:hypothetical protein
LIGIWWGQEIWTAVRTMMRHEVIPNKKKVLLPGIMLLISGLACLVNPRGVGIVNYLQTLTGNSVVQNLVTEWAPPRINTLMGGLFFSGVIVSVVVMILSPKRPDFFQVVTLLVFGILGIRTSRGSVWFGLVVAPIVADHLTAIVGRYQKPAENEGKTGGSRVLNITLLVLILLLGVISLPWFKNMLPFPAAKAGLISAETPVTATEQLLVKAPPRQVFNSMSFGSYLIWAAYPQYQVFVDSRIELFPEKVWLDYLKISNAEGDWENLLQAYGVNTLMLSPSDQPALVKAAQISESWKVIYQDEVAYIFIRASGSE